MRKLANILVTGGAGFIGSNFIRHLFQRTSFDGRIVNVDKLTYAGNRNNLADIESAFRLRYAFERCDICDSDAISEILRRFEIDTVVHFAAESHVDRSINSPAEFIQTNILGTFTLIESVRHAWKSPEGMLFHNVSTDEVFGSLGETGLFTEETAYDPHSPYSASKASADHIVRASHHTYGVPVTISNCSNNYGPYQFPEKLIPLAILNLLDGKPVPVYGDGRNKRDWLYVEDHCDALWAILERGEIGRTYTIGGGCERENIDLVCLLCERIASFQGQKPDALKPLITFVMDRPGHDRRYAIDFTRISRELAWHPRVDLSRGLDATIQWYSENLQWVESIRNGEYRTWVKKQYGME